MFQRCSIKLSKMWNDKQTAKGKTSRFIPHTWVFESINRKRNSSWENYGCANSEYSPKPTEATRRLRRLLLRLRGYVWRCPRHFGSRFWICTLLWATAQLPGESLGTFVSALFELSSDYKLGTTADELIRDLLVAKTSGPQLREWLLLEGSLLTLEWVVQIGRPFEETSCYAKELMLTLVCTDSRRVTCIMWWWISLGTNWPVN